MIFWQLIYSSPPEVCENSSCYGLERKICKNLGLPAFLFSCALHSYYIGVRYRLPSTVPVYSKKILLTWNSEISPKIWKQKSSITSMSSMSKIDSKVSISVTLPLAPRETDLYPVIEVVSLPQYTN